MDRFGNLVVGSYNNSWRADAHEIGSVWRMSAGTRELAEIIDYKIRCSNATCFTPDGRTMFFCDSPTRRVYCFDYDPRAGLSNRRLLYELPSDMDGSPDGAQCDADGCPWIAISGASKVIRVSRDGVVDHEIELPVKLRHLRREARHPLHHPRAGRGSVYAVKAPEGIRGVPGVVSGTFRHRPRGRTRGGAGMAPCAR